MTKIANPCGCVADDKKWIVICKVHQELHDLSMNKANLDALWRLIQYYEKYPTSDNLHHVVERIKTNGSLVAKHPQITAWIIANRKLLAPNRAR